MDNNNYDGGPCFLTCSKSIFPAEFCFLSTWLGQVAVRSKAQERHNCSLFIVHGLALFVKNPQCELLDNS